MNSADKRIEELLNRAGQTISDLPKEYKGDNLRVVVELKYIGFGSETDNLIQHILHLTDVIDRFEWALENTCNERDYLAYRLRRYRDCQSCERVNECKRTPDHCLGWVFGGVPDDWSVDDE